MFRPISFFSSSDDKASRDGLKRTRLTWNQLSAQKPRLELPNLSNERLNIYQLALGYYRHSG